MDKITPIEHSDNTPKNDSIKTQSFDEVASIFDYEKGSVTIDKEINEFNSIDSSEREIINDSIEEKVGIGLDDLGSEENSGSAFEEFNVEEEEEVEENSRELEDYFSSAEFVIFVTELIIVWGTNLYLQKNQLDKISVKEFEKTAREQKFLVQSWAKVLMKHNAQVSAEMELLFAMGSTYGMKIRSIVAEQKLRKREKDLLIKEAKLKEKRKKPKNVVDNDSDNDITDFEEVAEEKTLEKESKRKPKITKDNFKLETNKEITEDKEEQKEEISDKKNPKKHSKGISDLIVVENE